MLRASTLLPALRRLAGRERTSVADFAMGWLLAFVAGLTNVVGFVAVEQYTSHMTGVVSMIAGRLAFGDERLALLGVGSLAAFIGGAAVASSLIEWGRRRSLESAFALPLLVEAIALLGFGAFGSRVLDGAPFYVTAVVVVLCFVMGMQNAIITCLTRATIRSTHLTGLVTDIGISLGRIAHARGDARERTELAVVRRRLATRLRLLFAFFAGAFFGGIGFPHVGFLSIVPLALVLLAIAIVPVLDDALAPRANAARREERR